MRMNLHQPTTAADLVNTCPETELAAIFYEHGNEKASRQIARAIIKRRQTKRFLNTLDLAGVVAETIPYRRSTGLHPATKVFQALRIAVNQESAALEEVLPQAVEALATGGTLAVISFHSGEDKVVKDFLRNHSQEWLDTPDYPNSLPNPLRQLESPKRILPSENEMIANPRSRSARLRIAKKL
jgi:16S rRNA (cytosine1402-N4)-methyltransferase